MFAYILIGAIIGAFIGYLIPPGSLFWFVLGGTAGFFFRNYAQRRYL